MEDLGLVRPAIQTAAGVTGTHQFTIRTRIRLALNESHRSVKSDRCARKPPPTAADSASRTIASFFAILFSRHVGMPAADFYCFRNTPLPNTRSPTLVPSAKSGFPSLPSP